jgi:CBS domain containing-hemolysin-like protein
MHPIMVARRVARAVQVSLVVLWPMVFLLEALTRPLGRLLGHRKDAFGFAELQVAISEGERVGAVDETMARVMRGGLSLERKTEQDVLVPRVDIVGVDATATYDECLSVFRREEYSRLLVMHGTPDADVGYLSIKDLTRLPPEDRATWTAERGAREAVRVHSSMPLTRLLARMRRSGKHFACVKDEYGGTVGIVTLEDVLVELVGQIRDEHDSDEPAPVRAIQAHVWLVRGDVNVREFADRYGLPLKTEEARTMGGLVAEALGRVPRQGDVVERDGVRLLVAQVEEKRVLLVRVVRLQASSGPGDGPAGL